MSWLESHQELRDHPKTARLRRRLGVSLPQAIGHLHLLWWWALDYAPTGHLAVYDADVIADAACWEDDPGVFVRALIGAGFVNDDMTIHDWDDYAGRLIEQREANARRKRRARQARRDDLLAQVARGAALPITPTTAPAGTVAHPTASGTTASGARPAGPDADTTGTSPGRPADVQGLPDLTGPNRTGPDRTTPTPTPPPQAGEGERITEMGPGDLELWSTALGAASVGMKPGNADQLKLLEPLGRDDAGALHLRAPPGLGLERFVSKIALALADAGDAAAQGVVIREG